MGRLRCRKVYFTQNETQQDIACELSYNLTVCGDKVEQLTKSVTTLQRLANEYGTEVTETFMDNYGEKVEITVSPSPRYRKLVLIDEGLTPPKIRFK